jgi:hypothetical protein
MGSSTAEETSKQVSALKGTVHACFCELVQKRFDRFENMYTLNSRKKEKISVCREYSRPAVTKFLGLFVMP